METFRGTRRFVEGQLAQAGRAVPTKQALRPIVMACIDAGRWIAHCTNPRCRGAVGVDLEDLWMYCLSCHNAHVDGAWLQITMPENYEEIEKALEDKAPWEQFWRIQ